MHDLESARFELPQDPGESERRRRLNVVQEQDPSAPRLEPGEGASRDLMTADASPIVGSKIHAPGHVAARAEILLDGDLPPQTGDPEERSDRLGIIEHGAQ